MTQGQPNFDPIAKAYRWLEYLTLGHSLERCRFHFLPQLVDRTSGLVLGDGDGRFTANLLRQNQLLHVDAVDSSAAMLVLLRERCLKQSPSSGARLRLHQIDALTFSSSDAAGRYDLVATHFFLDCLTQPEVDRLASSLAAHLAPGAIWLVSDFRIPRGLMHFPATVIVSTLYLAFRLITGLRVRRLPDHGSALIAAGFTLSARHVSLLGMLATELWSYGPTPGEPSASVLNPT